MIGYCRKKMPNGCRYGNFGAIMDCDMSTGVVVGLICDPDYKQEGGIGEGTGGRGAKYSVLNEKVLIQFRKLVCWQSW